VEGSSEHHALAWLPPGNGRGTHLTVDCVDPRDDVENFEIREIVCSLPGFKMQTIQPIPLVTITATMYWLTVSASDKRTFKTGSKEI